LGGEVHLEDMRLTSYPDGTETGLQLLMVSF